MIIRVSEYIETTKLPNEIKEPLGYTQVMRNIFQLEQFKESGEVLLVKMNSAFTPKT